MDNLQYLERFINSLGWYSGTSNLIITVTGAFEGFSGRATETWEYQTIIELKEVKSSDGQIICPHIRVVGKSYEGIDKVAERVVNELSSWKNDCDHKIN